MKTNFIYIILAIISGIVLPIQAGLNIQLGKAVQQPVFAAFASFLIGTIALLIVLFAIRFDFSQILISKDLNPIVWSAGILGAIYVVSVIYVAPQIGVALTFAILTAGQVGAALIMDHFGLMDLPEIKLSWKKVLGGLLLVLGVWLTK